MEYVGESDLGRRAGRRDGLFRREPLEQRLQPLPDSDRSGLVLPGRRLLSGRPVLCGREGKLLPGRGLLPGRPMLCRREGKLLPGRRVLPGRGLLHQGEGRLLPTRFAVLRTRRRLLQRQKVVM
jgi:hypothetical protein